MICEGTKKYRGLNANSTANGKDTCGWKPIWRRRLKGNEKDAGRDSRGASPIPRRVRNNGEKNECTETVNCASGVITGSLGRIPGPAGSEDRTMVKNGPPLPHRPGVRRVWGVDTGHTKTTGDYGRHKVGEGNGVEGKKKEG